ncbi:MAG: alpha/beta fold hydrolase [Acidobacteriota bacterium]
MQRRWTLGVMAALLGTASLLPAAATADDPPFGRPAAGSLFLHPERIAFEDGGWLEAERGVIYVPTRRTQSTSQTISVEVYRFPAAEGVARDMPPIFVLHGGPGWPGLEGSLESSRYYDSRLRPLTELADVVVVGQRGIGSSKPNTACEAPPESEPDAEVTEAMRFAAMRQASEQCRAFWDAAGLDLKGFTVIEAAADVNDIRQALGYEQIILWGGSFGSHWSMAVMRYYPETVARAVLTGLEGPDHTYDMPSETFAAIERMAEAAEASAELAPHLPEEGLVEAFRGLIARLEKEPLMLTVDHPETGEPRKVRFDASDVRGMARGYTGSAGSRRRLPRWPGELLELLAGDFSQPARRALNEGSGFPTASFFMLDCGSGISQARLEKLLADPAVEVIGPLGWFYRASCPAWGSDLGEDFRQNFETDIPSALIHGNWDTSTPLENAQELAPFFKRGKLVVVKGGTHGALREALNEADGFRDQLAQFIRTGDLSGLPEEVQLPPIEWDIPAPESAEGGDE